MEGHKVEIRTSDELSTKGTRVFIDGEEVKRLVDVQFEHFSQDVPRLTLTFIPERTTITGAALAEGTPLDVSELSAIMERVMAELKAGGKYL